MLRRRFILLLLATITLGCGRTPQLGPDEATFNSVDALYTAVTARRTDLLTACETRLRERHDAGKLPDAAWTELCSIIATSRDGKWEAAAERLYAFMKRQEMRSGIESAKPHKR